MFPGGQGKREKSLRNKKNSLVFIDLGAVGTVCSTIYTVC